MLQHLKPVYPALLTPLDMLRSRIGMFATPARDHLHSTCQWLREPRTGNKSVLLQRLYARQATERAVERLERAVVALAHLWRHQKCLNEDCAFSLERVGDLKKSQRLVLLHNAGGTYYGFDVCAFENYWKHHKYTKTLQNPQTRVAFSSEELKRVRGVIEGHPECIREREEKARERRREMRELAERRQRVITTPVAVINSLERPSEILDRHTVACESRWAVPESVIEERSRRLLRDVADLEFQVSDDVLVNASNSELYDVARLLGFILTSQRFPTRIHLYRDVLGITHAEQQRGFRSAVTNLTSFSRLRGIRARLLTVVTYLGEILASTLMTEENRREGAMFQLGSIAKAVNNPGSGISCFSDLIQSNLR